MYKRTIQQELIQCSREYPIVTVVGPRQSGKTTLARAVFPGHVYVNLEQPEQRFLAEQDPKSFFHRFHSPMIIDEVQNVPSLLSWIQVMVDENPEQKGQYILTGSHQLSLHEAISQSLAGRTAMLTLLPLSLSELPGQGSNFFSRGLCRAFMTRRSDRSVFTVIII